MSRAMCSALQSWQQSQSRLTPRHQETKRHTDDNTRKTTENGLSRRDPSEETPAVVAVNACVSTEGDVAHGVQMLERSE